MVRKKEYIKALVWLLFIIAFDVLTYNIHELCDEKRKWVTYYPGRFAAVSAYALLPLIFGGYRWSAFVSVFQMWIMHTFYMAYCVGLAEADLTDNVVAIFSFVNILTAFVFLTRYGRIIEFILTVWTLASLFNMIHELFFGEIRAVFFQSIGLISGLLIATIMFLKNEKRKRNPSR